MSCIEVTTVSCQNKLATRIAEVCCDRIQLAHSASFIELTFVVISQKTFLWSCFAFPRLLRSGATASFPLSCATDPRGRRLRTVAQRSEV